MKNKYEILEKKYIKDALAELRSVGYKSCFKVMEIQDLIKYLMMFYMANDVDLIDNEDDAKLYFNRIITGIPQILTEFLLGYYRARTARLIMIDPETNERKFAEFSYYPITINKYEGSIKKVIISYIGFDSSNGQVLKAPTDFNVTKGMTLEELYEQNKDSTSFDLTFIKNYLMVNGMDIKIRNLVIECAARRLIGIQELDLDVRLKRATTFIKSMTYNIPNYKEETAMIEMIQNLYEQLKENKLNDGDYGLKKNKK